MFGPGLAEYLTLALDPVIAWLLLWRWSFYFVPLAVAWIMCTIVAVIAAGLVAIAMNDALPKGAGPALWVPALLLAVAVLVAPRAVLLRRVSTSSSFRADTALPLPWGRAVVVSVVAFVGAMAIATGAGLLLK